MLYSFNINEFPRLLLCQKQNFVKKKMSIISIDLYFINKLIPLLNQY